MAELDLSRSSAGEITEQAQRANDDGANTVSPRPDPVTATSGTNADRYRTSENTDSGTDDRLRDLGATQSIPPITAEPGSVLGDLALQDRPTFEAAAAATRDDAPGFGPTRVAGQGAAREDQTKGTGTATRAALDQRFANTIKPQGNVLDQYASYTYNISIYLMSPTDYKQLIANPNARPRGSQLLIQSAGAPAGAGIVPGSAQPAEIEDPGAAAQAQRAGLGRNEFFSLDYYLDDVQLTSFISGKATGISHNVTQLRFRVIEPNGITFLDNLYRATDQYVRMPNSAQTNYAAQTYLMVIRFYGYDSDGNLVLAQNQSFVNPTDGRPIATQVEKLIPFQFTSIKFRVANKIVEYDCECVAVSNRVASTQPRGVIPYNVELTSQTLKDLLGGQEQYAQTAATGEGRVASALTRTANSNTDPRAREPVNAGYINTNETGEGTDFTLGVAP